MVKCNTLGAVQQAGYMRYIDTFMFILATNADQNYTFAVNHYGFFNS